MDTTNLYERLAEHLDQGAMGSPKSPALMGILEVLFPADEAAVAVALPLTGTPLSELESLFPEQADTLGNTLERMARRGTVYASQKPGRERTYRLLPSVVGWSETPFWAGRETKDTRKLAPLWIKYREEAFGAELARGDMPVMRVLPVSKSLNDPRAVLPFNEVESRLCIGCGVCTPTCPTEAVDLELRGEVIPPPDLSQFLTARMKQA